MTTRNSTTQPTHEDPQTIQKLLVGVIGLIDTFSADQRSAALFGFDDPRRTLGEKEEGAKVALPIWMDFMGEALKGNQPVGGFPQSPLLTKPEQVKQILASASTDFLAERRTPAPALLNVAKFPNLTSARRKSAQPGGAPKTDATSLGATRSEPARPREVN